jgi:hypothetical protein
LVQDDNLKGIGIPRRLPRHVGVEQGRADLAQRLGDIGLGQRAAAAQPVEYLGQPV